MKIKEWAEEDRPREKMLLKGIASLSRQQPGNCRPTVTTYFKFRQ